MEPEQDTTSQTPEAAATPEAPAATEKATEGPTENAASENDDSEQESTQPPTQDDFGAFGPGASLLFRAPDPEEIRRAAEAQKARLREAAQERDAERAAHRDEDEDDENGSVSSRRRRRRRRGDEDMELVDDSDGSVTRVRAPRGAAGSGRRLARRASTASYTSAGCAWTAKRISAGKGPQNSTQRPA